MVKRIRRSDDKAPVRWNTRCPCHQRDTSPKRVLRELPESHGPKFGFKVDVKDAHRLIIISPQDWHLLACRSEKTKEVYINMTGTFGVASAAYWWSRVAIATVRGEHHIPGPELASMLLVHLRVMGFPLSWKKLAGGERLQWVGYEMLLKSPSLGLSAS